MKDIFELLFYWTPTCEADEKYSTTTLWFNSYENAKKYLKKQEFDILNQPNLIEINQFKFNELGIAVYETTILRGYKKGISSDFIDLNKLHKN